jgi:haloalkane dehalogenase
MVTPPDIPDWLARLYPFSPRKFLTPAGATMSYLDEGPRHDEAVLMLHGNPTWSFFYRNLVHAVRGTLRCVVPDHIGMGLSEKPQNYDYTLARRIADIEALVAMLKLKRVHLVVHDWGGAIGFGFAAKHPELIGRIVILNTAAFASPNIPKRIAICKMPVIGPLLVRGLNGFAWPATWMAMNARQLAADEKRAYLLPYDSWANRVAVCEFVRDIPLRPAHRSWATLAAVEQGLAQFKSHPITLLWGAKDFCFDRTFFKQWTATFPGAEQAVFESAGHYLLEDSPEALDRAAAFLTRV